MRVSNTSTRPLEGKPEGTRDTKEISKAPSVKEGRVRKSEKKSDLPNQEKVEISSTAKDAVKAKALAVQSPDVNEEKVERLRNSIKNGSYKVNEDQIADRMLKEHIETAV